MALENETITLSGNIGNQIPLEANSSSASEESPYILRNPKVHYRLHNSPPRVTILSQINPVHALPNDVFNIQFNIILSSTSRYPKSVVFNLGYAKTS